MQRVHRQTAVWRWVFLCAQTVLLTLLALITLDLHRSHAAVEGTPRFLHLLERGFLLLACFLLVAGPFFFRRLGWIALTAWIGALAALVWTFVPVF